MWNLNYINILFAKLDACGLICMLMNPLSKHACNFHDGIKCKCVFINTAESHSKISPVIYKFVTLGEI